MKFIFNEHCPLKMENIGMDDCIEITAELDGLKTEEHLIKLRKILNMTNEQMLKICEKCPNYASE